MLYLASSDIIANDDTDLFGGNTPYCADHAHNGYSVLVIDHAGRPIHAGCSHCDDNSDAYFPRAAYVLHYRYTGDPERMPIINIYNAVSSILV
jgi:hypothetical protein